jgi:hypothetical protein
MAIMRQVLAFLFCASSDFCFSAIVDTIILPLPPFGKLSRAERMMMEQTECEHAVEQIALETSMVPQARPVSSF